MKLSAKSTIAIPFLYSIFAANVWAVDPVPDIKALGSDGPVDTTTTAIVEMTVELAAGDRFGTNADWWVVADTPIGWYYLDLSNGWLPGFSATYQGQLFDMEPVEILNTAGLAPGSYTVYFGVDVKPNGALDLEPLFYESVELSVRESNVFNIVDTNQSEDFTATVGEDSDYVINPPSYTDNGDGTVTDNVTGLMWQQSPDTNGDGDIDTADKLSYAEAVAGASSLSLGGYSDWRLPTIKELYSLIDFSGLDPSGYEGTDTSGLVPFIDTDYFDFAYGDTDAGARIIDAQYASSTLYVANTAGPGGGTMFGVNLADGRIKGYPLTMFGSDVVYFVLYVRGNASYGQNDFADNGDGTITDQATDLMWSQDDSAEGLDWEKALAWVAQKNDEAHLGYSDWRLPNAKELQGIVDYTRSPDTTGSAAIDPLFDATLITNEALEDDYPFYWSSTTHANWTDSPGLAGAYVAFGRAMGYMNGNWVDVHGAGAQRSDPKSGDPADYPEGRGPQGDAIRIYNYVRLVRDAI